ncbi:MAG: hypothetical protein KIT45_13365 [Fimbriimonadia bacterium]|nr:hypothetical protein [Fimbriimonadia bacterium]
MKLLGKARVENGKVELPANIELEEGALYDVIQMGDDLLLSPPSSPTNRMERIEQLAKESIQMHKKSLEGLAK